MLYKDTRTENIYDIPEGNPVPEWYIPYIGASFKTTAYGLDPFWIVIILLGLLIILNLRKK